jgi:hypothetical protein
MEKLLHLETLPPTGFMVSCFPVKIERASARLGAGRRDIRRRSGMIPAPGADRGEFARGWPLVAAGLIGIAAGISSLYFYSLGIFLKPLAASTAGAGAKPRSARWSARPARR